MLSVHSMNGADGPGLSSISPESSTSHNERVAETRKRASMEAASGGDHR